MQKPYADLLAQLRRNLRISVMLCVAGLVTAIALVAEAHTPNVRDWGYLSLGCWVVSAVFLGVSAHRYRSYVRQLAHRP